MRNLIKSSFYMLMLVVLLAANTHSAKADQGLNLLGTISEINADAGVITVIATDGNVYYVPVTPEQLANMVVGGAVELHGTVAPDGTTTFSADDSVSPDPSTDPAPLDPGSSEPVDYYCSQTADQNPIGADLVLNYGADYLVLQQLACDYKMTWSDIQNLVINAEFLSVDPALLALAAQAHLDDDIIAQITHSSEDQAEQIEDLLEQYQENLQGMDDNGTIDDGDFSLDDIDGDENDFEDNSGYEDDDDFENDDDDGEDIDDDDDDDDSEDEDDEEDDDDDSEDEDDAEGNGSILPGLLA